MKSTLRLIPVILLFSFLGGCAGLVAPPATKMAWKMNNGLEISALRDGCDIVQFQLKNNGTTVSKAMGNLDVLDAESNVVLNVTFICGNAYPGGTTACSKSQKFLRNYNAYPGFFCDGAFKQFRISGSAY